jgi:hypothetical protein
MKTIQSVFRYFFSPNRSKSRQTEGKQKKDQNEQSEEPGETQKDYSDSVDQIEAHNVGNNDQYDESKDHNEVQCCHSDEQSDDHNEEHIKVQVNDYESETAIQAKRNEKLKMVPQSLNENDFLFSDESIEQILLLFDQKFDKLLSNSNWKMEYLHRLRSEYYDPSTLQFDCGNVDIVDRLRKEIGQRQECLKWTHWVECLVEIVEDAVPESTVSTEFKTECDRMKLQFVEYVEALRHVYELFPEDHDRHNDTEEQNHGVFPIKGPSSITVMSRSSVYYHIRPPVPNPNEGDTRLRKDGIQLFLNDKQKEMVTSFFHRTKIGDPTLRKLSKQVVLLDFQLTLFDSDLFLTELGKSHIEGVVPRVGFLVEQMIVLLVKIFPFYVKLEAKMLLLMSRLNLAREADSVNLQASPSYFGVSLYFLKEFVRTNHISDPNLTTGQVVQQYIVPQTREYKSSYVNAMVSNDSLSCHKPIADCISDLRTSRRHHNHVWYQLGNLQCYHEGLLAFVSHAWFMPFLQLLDIVEVAMNQYYNPSGEKNLHEQRDDNFDTTDSNKFQQYNYFSKDQLDQSCYFWIDIFCKNQHNPAPDMEEFHQMIKACDKVIVCVESPERPISFQRIWCIYEIWMATFYNLDILPTMSSTVYNFISETSKGLFNESRHLFKQRHLEIDVISPESIAKTEEFKQRFVSQVRQMLNVDVANAKATFQADIDMILNLIKDKMSLEEFNRRIMESTLDVIWKKIVQDYGYEGYNIHTSNYCFDGNCMILLADGTKKRVDQLTLQDKVKTVTGTIAKIALIVKQDIPSNGVGIAMCCVNQAWFTEDHPIAFPMNSQVSEQNQEWKKAKDVPHCFEIKRNITIYNLELSTTEDDNDEYGLPPSSAIINDVGVMTLGQCIGFDAESDALYGYGWKTNPMRALLLV